MTYVKKTVLLFLFGVASFICGAQMYKVDSVIYNGPVNRFINFVFLGDGFKEPELSDYISGVQKSGLNIFNIAPFREYKNYFNLFAIRIPSSDSGTDHPRTAPDCPAEPAHPKTENNTAFNTTFDSNSIHRLLVVSNHQAVNSVIIQNFPLFDQKIMLVNTPHYGGSGGSTAVASLHTSSNELVLHEAGHSFSGLADEYWAGDGYANERVNLTKETNPALVKWKNWLGVDGVGIYPHGTAGTAAQWYRPHERCKMRSLGNEFCPVCREALTLTILKKFGSPVREKFPVQDVVAVSDEKTVFKLHLYKPLSNTLRVKWILNGKQVALNTDSLTVTRGMLTGETGTLKAEILDTTSFIRAENHAQLNTHLVSWSLKNPATQIKEFSQRVVPEIFPNPFTGVFELRMNNNQQPSEFNIVDLTGRVLISGRLTGKTFVDASRLHPGIYFLQTAFGNLRIVKI